MYFSLSKFFLFIVPLNVVIVSTSTLFPFIVGKYVWFRTAVDVSVIFFLLGLLFCRERGKFYENRLWRALKQPLVIAVLSFVVIFNIAGFFGIDPANSFWSNFERGEGGIQILHLGLFFLLLIALFEKESDWKKIFYLSIVGAVLMIAYGVLALGGTSGFAGTSPTSRGFWEVIVRGGERFSGSIGNPAYVAAYLIYVMFYAAYIFLSGFSIQKHIGESVVNIKKKIVSGKNVALAVVFFLFLIFFFFAGTRGAFLGLTAAIIFFMSYLAFSSERWRKYFFVSILSLLVVIVVLVALKDTAFVKKIPGSRVLDISISARTFKDRLIMWNIALEGFKQRPILGWGPENYYQVFDRNFDVSYFKPMEGFGAWFDRAHNVFLDHLVEAGIFGLVSYVGIFAVFYWEFFKKIFKKKGGTLINALVFAFPIAHLVQGLMLFEVLTIYLNLFLFLAFAAYYLYFREQN